MSAPARLTVATTCPACAAPLDVVEGASSARCGHCGNRLLLPGRRSVLAYLVRPRIDGRTALATVRAARPAAGEPALCLLPYYRYTAEELRWDWPATVAADGSRAPDATQPPALAERAVERNFLACAWDGLGLYSMGVRTTALRLELLRADALPPGARVLAVETPAADALAHALRLVDASFVAHRVVVAGVLSVVYFPFWVAPGGEGDARVSIVDAVTGALVAADGPPALGERLAAAAAPLVTPIAPRVLLCPNCGWDLPDDPDHVVFYCAQCRRAWRLDHERLEPLAHAVVRPPAGCAGALEHRPLWTVDVLDAGAAPRRIVVPAFRHRARRLVLTLATLLTRAAPEAAADGVATEPAGAYLDRDDAVAVARFVAAGIDPRRAPAWSLGKPRIAWWPFERLAGSLREPYTRFALPAVGRTPAPGRRAPTAHRARA